VTRTIILSLLLSACSVDPDAFSVQGGQEYESAFETASLAWCEASDGACCPHLDQSGESSVRPATAEELAGLARGYELSGYYVTDGDTGATAIRILDRFRGDDLLKTMLHELGHHCGCGSEWEDGTPEAKRGSVMYRAHDHQGIEITAEDAACAR
jgi:hypothetical protein